MTGTTDQDRFSNDRCLQMIRHADSERATRSSWLWEAAMTIRRSHGTEDPRYQALHLAVSAFDDAHAGVERGISLLIEQDPNRADDLHELITDGHKAIEGLHHVPGGTIGWEIDVMSRLVDHIEAQA